MEFLTEEVVQCPYCGEALDVLIDPQDIGQQYIEDCQVCCQPITFNVTADAAGSVVVSVRDENETY
ncbi:MAG TPA: CPXCG motif-containing cysteine-rich protein [Alcanivoracaceae bacterium]|nr:CPXCG motif-containing cysteine-rich protein [Alcanivoracaceae bacterium]